VPDLVAYNPALKNRRVEPPVRPAIMKDMIIRDGDGFDGDGIDEGGFNRLGFDEWGQNRAGQSMTDFPPEFLAKLQKASDRAYAEGTAWMAPAILDIGKVRQQYPVWYKNHDAIFPEDSQVREPLSVTFCCAGCTNLHLYTSRQ
jgi:hypothetical protein